MPVRAPWFAQWPKGRYPGTTLLKKASGETFQTGDLVVKNGSDEAVKITVSDPVAIFGVALGSSAIEDPDSVLVLQVASNRRLACYGLRDPVSGDVGNEVDLRVNGNVLIVDPDGNAAPRVGIHEVFPPRGLYIVSVLPAYIQV